mmetsp:Transcript_20024/g.31472  ORF Transcript_20024/g.31472 Transcript_20024/m.31472 type:complete len:553 (+) Transcript_20024:131-1789(+)
MGSGASTVDLNDFAKNAGKSSASLGDIFGDLQACYQAATVVDPSKLKSQEAATEWAALILALEEAGATGSECRLTNKQEAKKLLLRCKKVAVSIQSGKVTSGRPNNNRGKTGKSKSKKRGKAPRSKVQGIEKHTCGEINDESPGNLDPEEAKQEEHPVDPWTSLKSPFGGKLSPAEEWQLISSGGYAGRAARILPADLAGVGLSLSMDRPSVVEGQAVDALVAAAAAAAVSATTWELEEAEEGGGPPAAAAAGAPVNAGEHQDQAGNSNSGAGASDSIEKATCPTSGCSKLSFAGCGINGVLNFSISLRSQLVSLDVSGNMLQDSFGGSLGTNFIRELVLAGNHLDAIPDLTSFPKLVRLDISYNPLGTISVSDFPEAVAGRLHSLSLASTGLNSLCAAPAAAGTAAAAGGVLRGFRALQVLDLSRNKLETLSDLKVISRVLFPKLSELFIDSNPFCQAEEYIEELMHCAKQFATLKRLNGVIFQPTMISSKDALASAMERSLDTLTQHASSGESCSCIEGNPCAVPDNCHNWPNRYEVAKRVREDKYDNIF